MITGCGTPRRLPKGQALMHKYKIHGVKGGLAEDVNVYVRQKPNRKLLGIGFLKIYLGIYNMVDHGKTKKWKNKIKSNLGERPVIYDSTLTEFSSLQIKQFLFNKGYFNAEVSYTDTIIRKKAYVNYIIKKNTPYTVRNIHYNIKDSLIRSIYFAELNESKLVLGEVYDQDKIQQERERITKSLKNHGYFYFNREYIHFDIDSTLNTNQIDIYLAIENQRDGSYHKAYKINSVLIDVKPSANLSQTNSKKDTVLLENIQVYDPERKFNPRILKRMLYINPDNIYKVNDVDLTYSRFGDLGIFKFVTINFNKSPSDSNKLNCIIELSPGQKQALNTEVEAYFASENVGSSINFIYSNRNIFKNAEIFEFKIRGGIETQAFIDEKERQGIPIFNSGESNTSASILFPKFLFLPENRSVNKYTNSRTRIGFNYVVENRPEYQRNTLNGSFNYEWKQSKFVFHSVSPIDIRFVTSDLSNEALEVFENINNPYLKASFDPHISLVTRYTLTLNNQIINRVKDYFYLRFNIEAAGTTLYLFNTLLNKTQSVSNTYSFFDLPFYNYTRPEIDLRYFDYLSPKTMLAYRISSGIGFTYWNSDVLPFERQFFTGGSNSIRAYRARGIGPGSFTDSNNSNLNLDQTGDMKIEGNVEYRFDVFDRFFGSKLKGATFLDWGNVWNISEQNNTPGGKFILDTFYKEFAIGTGAGLRMDYGFLLLRFDFGLKLRDPQFPESDRWVIQRFNDKTWKQQNEYGFINFNFGVGYPF